MPKTYRRSYVDRDRYQNEFAMVDDTSIVYYMQQIIMWLHVHQGSEAKSSVISALRLAIAPYMTVRIRNDVTLNGMTHIIIPIHSP